MSLRWCCVPLNLWMIWLLLISVNLLAAWDCMKALLLWLIKLEIVPNMSLSYLFALWNLLPKFIRQANSVSCKISSYNSLLSSDLFLTFVILSNFWCYFICHSFCFSAFFNSLWFCMCFIVCFNSKALGTVLWGSWKSLFCTVIVLHIDCQVLHCTKKEDVRQYLSGLIH